jgi:lipid II:glycine glycyltransferase (peptidoglycan interpeptide bridge formation enzyme)
MVIMVLRFAHTSEIEQWNKLILSNPDGGNVFQGMEFATQKQLGGWRPRYIMADLLALTILEKTVVGLGKLWYLPKGPGITSPDQLTKLLPDLQAFARQHNVFLIKIEPELPATAAPTLRAAGLVKATPIQPNFSTVTVDISASLEHILTSLNQKGRHAIKRAERDGVRIKQVEATDENCQLMYRLLADTAEGSFRIRTYAYYKTFWQRYASIGTGQLFFAYVEGTLVAGAYAVVFGHKSTYKDGASIRERTVYGASHLLQWHVIEWAKAHGSTVHDLCGAPPSAQIKDPTHPHYGIGRFKTSFNKEVTDYVGVYDLVIRPLAYQLWYQLGERIVVRLHNYRYHENYY